jgi:hypothetical protein
VSFRHQKNGRHRFGTALDAPRGDLVVSFFSFLREMSITDYGENMHFSLKRSPKLRTCRWTCCQKKRYTKFLMRTSSFLCCKVALIRKCLRSNALTHTRWSYLKYCHPLFSQSLSMSTSIAVQLQNQSTCGLQEPKIWERTRYGDCLMDNVTTIALLMNVFIWSRVTES